MKKQKNVARIIVNAQKHAVVMARAMGRPKAYAVAKGCLESAKKLLNEDHKCITQKEVKKNIGFWTDMVGILSKSERDILA